MTVVDRTGSGLCPAMDFASRGVDLMIIKRDELRLHEKEAFVK
jgi:hypothetical protein